MTKKILLPIILAAALVFCMLPTAAFAVAAVCQIGATTYNTLGEALGAVADGETIQLLMNIEHSTEIEVVDKSITFDLNGCTLNVTGGNYGLSVDGGTVDIVDTIGGGALNVSGPVRGVSAINGGHAKVTSAAATGNDGTGAYAQGAESSVVVTGNATADVSGGIGASAFEGSTISIGGDVQGVSYGVEAMVNGSVVEVAGNVSSTENGSTAVNAAINSTVKVTGSVTAGGTGSVGVWANSGGTAEIGGAITAPVYIRLEFEDLAEGEGEQGMGDYKYYLVYSDNNGNAVRVRSAICEIDGVKFMTLDDALATIGTGDTKTIKLLTDIDHNTGISAIGRSITFDLNGRTLRVLSSTGYAVEAGSGGIIDITGDGALNAENSAESYYCVYAHHGGQAKVTSATATDSSGIAAYADGTDSLVDVTGDAKGNFYGASAINEGIINIGGKAEGAAKGVSASSGGTVNVGSVIATMSGGYGVFADGGTVVVSGDVTESGIASSSTGLSVIGGGTVTVDGSVISPTYIKLQYVDVTAHQGVQVMGDYADYLTYSDGSNTARVKIKSAEVGAEAAYDKKDNLDASTAITWNSAWEVADVTAGGTSLVLGSYFVSGNTLTISKDYLYTLPVGELNLSVVFNVGSPAALKITISDTRPKICEIDTVQYTTLEEALMSIQDGQTKIIKLLSNIDYNKGIDVFNKNITFNLNGYTLNAVNAAGHGLVVGSGGTVDITDATGTGAFNVKSTAEGGGSTHYCGVIALDGGHAEVTNANSEGGYGYAVQAEGSSSYVAVAGDAAATGANSFGVYAVMGGEISVVGDVSGVNFGADAVNTDSAVHVSGNVTVSGIGGYGVFANSGGTVLVDKNVTANGMSSYGVYAGGASSATIEGKIFIPSSGVYIVLQGVDFAPSAGVAGTVENLGYFVFSDTSSNIVRVKIKSAEVGAATAAFKRDEMADVTAPITWNDATGVTDVLSGGTTIGTENYSVEGSTLTIKQAYLAPKAVGSLDLTVVFDLGAPASLTVDITAPLVTVKFNPGKYGKVSPASRQFYYGDTYDLPKPKKSGYYFFGWYNGTDLFETGDLVEATSNFTLNARWVSSASVALKTPTLTARATDYKTITLKWNAVKGAEKYYIYKKIGGVYKFYNEVIPEAGAAIVEYKDTSVSKGVYYYYKVRALHTPYKDTVYSGYSYYKYAKPVWPAVSFKIASYTYNSINLTWTGVTGATLYDVLRSDRYNGEYVTISDPAGLTVTNFEDTTVEKGKTYYYKVKAYDGASSDRGITSSYKYAKAVWPTISLKAAPYTYNSIKLTWNKITGATAYEVQRCDKYNGTYEAIPGSSGLTETNFTDTTAEKGKTYYYKVKAYDSVDSTTSGYKYTKAAWPKVSFKIASYTYNSIGLTWTGVTGATLYEVQRSNRYYGPYVRVSDPAGLTETNFTDTTAVKGKTYYYKLRAYTPEDPSGALSSYKYAKAVWPKVSFKIASYTHNSIKLTWTGVTGATLYDVQRSNRYYGPYVRVSDPAGLTVTNFEDTTVVTGKTYYYKVRAYSPSDYGTLSSYKYAKAAWPTVTLTAASNTYNSIKLKWNTITGATDYEVWRYNSAIQSYEEMTSAPAEFDYTVPGYVSYTDESLSTGVTYYYRIKAHDSASYKWSSSKYAKPVPSAPTGVTAGRVNAITVKVLWDEVEGADGYAVYRASSKNGTYYYIGKTESGLTYDNTGLYASKYYYYKVRAYTKVGSTYVFGLYSAKRYA